LFGHLPVQRVEVLVRTGRAVEASEFQRLLLRALETHPHATPEQLDGVLRLGSPVLTRTLNELREAGLVRLEPEWTPTPLGTQVLREGSYSRPGYERRTFAFLDARPFAAPTFIRLPHSPALPDWPAAIDDTHPPLEVETVRDALARDDAWKTANGFPRDVEAAFGGEADTSASNGELLQPGWRRVVILSPERLTVVAADVDGTLRLFPARGEAIPTEPVLEIAPDSDLAKLAPEPTVEEWAEAWRRWCGSRNLSPDQTREVRIEGHVLRVVVSPSLDEHLATHGGEQWLLTDGAPLRTAAQAVWQRPD